MAEDPFTIRIFVPDGDPEGIRIVDRMNWTGLAIAFPREKWGVARRRPEFDGTGVYVLVGRGEGEENDDLPTVYVGEGDGIRDRIQSHAEKKDFWTVGYAFVAPNRGLNKAHVQWLEYALLQRAKEVGQCKLDNGNSPAEPGLSESEKADTNGFLKEIFRILPLLGVQAFERPKAIAAPRAVTPSVAVGSTTSTPTTDDRDTIVVPANKDGFESVFLGENCWYAIRISGGMLPKIRWIAAYQTAPTGAITHVAAVDRIEPYGDQNKYKVIFAGPAKPITPIPFGNAPPGLIQGPRYTSYQRLTNAKQLTDLSFGQP